MDLRKTLLVGLTAVSGLDCDERKEGVNESANIDMQGPAVRNIQIITRQNIDDRNQIRIHTDEGGHVGGGLICEI